MDKTQAIYNLVSKIPKGKVSTYGQIAHILGIKNPRYIGRVLHQNPNPVKIPCHRVVNSKGEVAQKYAFGGPEAQMHKLQNEGIIFQSHRLNLKKYRWFPGNISKNLDALSLSGRKKQINIKKE